MVSVIDAIIAEEGFVPHAYVCPAGYLTIGHGICIDKRKGCGITEAESYRIVQNRVAEIELAIRKKIAWWDALDDARKSALMSMAYQMGVRGLLGFHKMLDHMEAGEFDQAADESLNSTWARQTPARAKRVSDLIRNGE